MLFTVCNKRKIRQKVEKILKCPENRDK